MLYEHIVSLFWYVIGPGRVEPKIRLGSTQSMVLENTLAIPPDCAHLPVLVKHQCEYRAGPHFNTSWTECNQ